MTRSRRLVALLAPAVVIVAACSGGGSDNLLDKVKSAGKDYLPIDHPGVPGTRSKVKAPPKRVEVFDLGQRELLIAQARPVEKPLTLVRAYVTTRSKECGLVSWEDYNWKTARLTIFGDMAKTRESRSVGLVPELVARLAHHTANRRVGFTRSRVTTRWGLDWREGRE